MGKTDRESVRVSEQLQKKKKEEERNGSGKINYLSQLKILQNVQIPNEMKDEIRKKKKLGKTTVQREEEFKRKNVSERNSLGSPL